MLYKAHDKVSLPCAGRYGVASAVETSCTYVHTGMVGDCSQAILAHYHKETTELCGTCNQTPGSRRRVLSSVK